MVETAIAVAISCLFYGLTKYFIEKWDYSRTMPQETMVQLNVTDEKMIEVSKDIVREFFGSDVYETIANLKNTERIDLLARFAKRLAEEYGLDTDVDVDIYELENCGKYCFSENKAIFNISLLMVDKKNKYFKKCVHEVIENIFHELRHAVQWKAINHNSSWIFDEKTLKDWSDNITKNYIDPNVDCKGYCKQPVEADAMTFAARIMEGVA